MFFKLYILIFNYLDNINLLSLCNFDFLQNIEKNPMLLKLVLLLRIKSFNQNPMFKKVLIDILINQNKYVIINDNEKILKLIYFLNEFKDYRISYKKHLLNFNTKSEFKSFKIHKLYMINLFKVNKPLGIKNQSDTMNIRYYIINKKLYKEFLEFIEKNPLFYFDIEKSYIYSKDKYTLKSMNYYKNNNFNHIDFNLLLEKIYDYLKLRKINYEKFNIDNDYILYLIDIFYTYEYKKSIDIKINFVIDFLKYLDLNNLIVIDFNKSITNNSYYSSFISDLIKSNKPSKNNKPSKKTKKTVKKDNDLILIKKFLLNNIHFLKYPLYLNKIKKGYYKRIINDFNSIDNKKDLKKFLKDFIIFIEFKKEFKNNPYIDNDIQNLKRILGFNFKHLSYIELKKELTKKELKEKNLKEFNIILY